MAPATPGTPPPLGMRASLEDTVATRWVGTRRTITMEEGRKVFTGGFEAGKFGGGGNGHIIRFPLAPGSEYVFEYRFRFDPGFDFSRGGKIPGLGGGNAPSGCDTSTGVGFTARSDVAPAGPPDRLHLRHGPVQRLRQRHRDRLQLRRRPLVQGASSGSS